MVIIKWKKRYWGGCIRIQPCFSVIQVASKYGRNYRNHYPLQLPSVPFRPVSQVPDPQRFRSCPPPHNNQPCSLLPRLMHPPDWRSDQRLKSSRLITDRLGPLPYPCPKSAIREHRTVQRIRCFISSTTHIHSHPECRFCTQISVIILIQFLQDHIGPEDMDSDPVNSNRCVALKSYTAYSKVPLDRRIVHYSHRAE